MCTVLITISATLLSLAGSAVCSVFQNPPDLIKYKEEFVEMICEHTVKNYDRILWYKHNQNTGFQYIGYLNTFIPRTEPEFETKITLSGDGKKNGSLTIKSVSVNDSAVYFCAAYYTVL
ncbi:hypothetical protein C0J45_7969 [Silurus meridionalis]|uniref:Ig-like domain-containing protein n=1 Tax=Silurus meridionalis TaxID=175797 RepID=A0A8T0BCB9_SILME|nr:hypothetical protein HF521_021737 [Silurus meridionalis]KAI5102617.1 hypothetical protein C0J45_7969 [Silurus meridionalis]